MKGRAALMLCLLLFLTAAGGCGQKEKTEAGGFNVDVFIYDFSDTYIGSVRKLLDARLGAIPGIRYVFHDAGNSQDTQNCQIDSAIARGARLLIVNIVEPGSADIVLQKARNRDLPVIFFNREISDEALNSYDKTCFVGTDPDQAGYMQGQLAADLLLAEEAWEKADRNGDGKISYVMLRADMDNAEANGRTRYSVEETNRLLKEADKPPLERIGADINCSWAADKAKTAMDSFLISNPLAGPRPVELVLANNDEMALGAVQSLNAAGYNLGDPDKTVPVLGVDATATASDAIKNRRMAGTVGQDAETMARCIGDLAENVAEDRAFLHGTGYLFDASARKIRIPYQMFITEQVR